MTRKYHESFEAGVGLRLDEAFRSGLRRIRLNRANDLKRFFFLSELSVVEVESAWNVSRADSAADDGLFCPFWE